MTLLFGCGLGKQRDSAFEQSSLLGLGSRAALIRAFSTSLYPYVRTNCAACHGGSQSPKFASADPTSAYDEVKDRVSFNNPDLSTLVRKSKDGHCGQPCTTDGSQVTNLILSWKKALAAVGGTNGGQDIRVGNIFTSKIKVPAPDPMTCRDPSDLKCTSDGLDAGKPCLNRCWTKLKFPASLMTAAPGAKNTAIDPNVKRSWFEIDFAYVAYASDAGPASYVLRNPRVISVDGPVYIFDVKTWQNGTYRATESGDYEKIDTVVDKAIFSGTCTVPASPAAFDPYATGAGCLAAAQPLFSTASSTAKIIQEKTALDDPDQLNFSFEYYQEGVAGDCMELDMFLTKVYRPIQIQAVACLDCHKTGGAVSEAGMRFNMSLDEAVNGPNDLERKKTVCKKFLQRSNFNFVDNSPILVQPTQGLNGMPAQANFDSFKPDWKSWVQSEAAHHGK